MRIAVIFKLRFQQSRERLHIFARIIFSPERAVNPPYLSAVPRQWNPFQRRTEKHASCQKFPPVGTVVFFTVSCGGKHIKRLVGPDSGVYVSFGLAVSEPADKEFSRASFSAAANSTEEKACAGFRSLCSKYPSRSFLTATD